VGPGATGPQYELQFTPTGVAANGLNSYGASMAVSSETLLPRRLLRVRGGYRRIDMDAADTRDRWMGDARLSLIPVGGPTSAAVTGEYSHTTVAGAKYRVGAAVDQLLFGDLYAGVSGFYVHDESAGDVGVSGSATYRISGGSSVELGYRLPNDVEPRDYSLTVNQLLFTRQGVTTRLLLGAARDRTILATLSFVR
jgi:hypothetical protein